MFLYRTAAEETTVEETINRSRFIAHIKPVMSRDEGMDFLSGIKYEFQDATHNVPAMIIGPNQELQWMSDDGEPQGTAGGPILKVISKQRLTNLIIVVTRYFGGIKLGTGGLVRAYQGAAKQVIDKSGIVDVYTGLSMTYSIAYTYLDRIRASQEAVGYEISGEEYGEDVKIAIVADSDRAMEIKGYINDITSGSCTLVTEAEHDIRIKSVDMK